ncbi:MAG TPA: hypothetical protein VIH36_01295 [Casimicrobiaceae bacterium]|jgi:hypothetical protein
MKRLCAAVFAAVFAFAPMALAETATTIRAVDLKATPHADAKSVGSVAADSTVEVLSRQGAWVHIKLGRETGWTKLFDIRAVTSGAPARKTSDGIADTLGLAMGTRGSSVTTGVRGLDADMLEKATPNPAEFAKLVGYARSKEQATTFARAGRLATRDVAEIGASAKTAAGGAQ